MSIIHRVSLADQIAEVKREIAMRKSVYLRQIDAGKMNAEDAERRTVNMAAVLDTLEQVRDHAGEQVLMWADGRIVRAGELDVNCEYLLDPITRMIRKMRG